MQAANSESSQVFPHSIITALTSRSHEPEQETPGACLGSLEDGLGSLEDGLGSSEDGLGSKLRAGAGSVSSLLCWELQTTPIGFMRWHMQS